MKHAKLSTMKLGYKRGITITWGIHEYKILAAICSRCCTSVWNIAVIATCYGII